MSDSVIHAAAGALGGIAAMTATYPLVFISTRAAVETKNESKSTYQAILKIVQREGIIGLYSGLDSSLLGIAVTNGVYYYFYERSRGIMLKARGGKGGLTTLESILTGLIAGSFTTIVSTPLWVVQTSQAVRTLQNDSDSLDGNVKKLGIVKTIQSILETNGISGLWRGIGPALVLVINPVIQYTTFEQLKNFLIRRRTVTLRASGLTTAVAVLSDWDFFLLGALSKLVATASTYPYIVVKSRMQGNTAVYASAIQGILTILKAEGLHGLYKGIGSKLIQSVLTAALLFASQRRIYEATKRALQITHLT